MVQQPEIREIISEEDQKLLRERLMYGRRGGGGVVAAAAEMEKERYEWGDKYRPKELGEFKCNRRRAIELKKEINMEGGEIWSWCRDKHYIFEGGPGVGKRTMIRAMLRQAFGHQAMEVYYQYDLNQTSPPHLYCFFSLQFHKMHGFVLISDVEIDSTCFMFS